MPTTKTRTKAIPTAEEVAATGAKSAAYIAAHGIDGYRRMYTRGWSTRASTAWIEERGLFEEDAFQDGYLDSFAGREKWHLSRCLDHDHCGS